MSEEREVRVEVIDNTHSIVPHVEHRNANPFELLFAGAYESADEQLRVLWAQSRDAWLRTKESRSNSSHTRRSYEKASTEWMTFVSGIRVDGRPLQLWEVTSEHVRSWQEYLSAQDLKPSTVNQRLAACSSWYSYAAAERKLINGYEVSIFMDASGQTRLNPFSAATVQRARTQSYGNARILTPAETHKLLDYLEEKQHTLYGSRNHALLLTYLLTGYRNNEVISMEWGNIRPNRTQPGAFVFDWKGKGDKQTVDPLPPRAYHAIVAHLKIAGRWLPGHEDHIQDDEYIFRPLETKQLANLRNQAGLDPDEYGEDHISDNTVRRVLRSNLKRAGVERADQVRVHDLRHTFAHRFRENDKDLENLRARLHHESLATTGIYAREVLEEPVDNFSEDMYRSYRQAPLV